MVRIIIFDISERITMRQFTVPADPDVVACIKVAMLMACEAVVITSMIIVTA